jgi:pilus assembly protein Flp/PilA
MKTKLINFLRNQKGLTVVEYAVAGGLISLAVILAFQALGVTVGAIIAQINTLLSGAV